MNINFTPEAASDLDAIHGYIAEDNADAANRVIARILQSISILESFPLLGRAGKVPQTHEFSITGLPYFAVYTLPDETQIDIIAVIHTSRQCVNWHAKLTHFGG